MNGRLGIQSQILRIVLPVSVYLWTGPLFHCNGWCFPWAVTVVDGTHVCLRKVDPPHVWQIIEQEGVTHCHAAPTVLTMLTSHPSSRQAQLKRKLIVAAGGAPPSPTLIGQLANLGAEVVHLYGLTETYTPFTVCEIQPTIPAVPY